MKVQESLIDWKRWREECANFLLYCW